LGLHVLTRFISVFESVVVEA